MKLVAFGGAIVAAGALAFAELQTGVHELPVSVRGDVRSGVIAMVVVIIIPLASYWVLRFPTFLGRRCRRCLRPGRFIQTDIWGLCHVHARSEVGPANQSASGDNLSPVQSE
jgi:hypothetical protein